MSFSAQKKLLIIQRVKNGTSIASLSREQGVSRKTIYAWIHRYEHARTKAKQYAFQPKNPKGVDHWKAISTLEERKILRTIIKNPKLSLRSLAKATLLSAHAVWNFLERNNLHAFEQRIRYIQNNEIKILHEKTSAQKLAIIALVKSGENVSAICKQ